MKKVAYMVECGSGEFESFEKICGGIFLERSDAEKCVEQLDAKAKSIQLSCPIAYHDNLSEEEETLYWSYYTKNQRFMQWRPAKIREVVLNECLIC